VGEGSLGPSDATTVVVVVVVEVRLLLSKAGASEVRVVARRVG